MSTGTDCSDQQATVSRQRPPAAPQPSSERHRAILEAVRSGVQSAAELRDMLGISRVRLSQLVHTCPGLACYRDRTQPGGPLILSLATPAEVDDDEPWEPQPWIHPYRAQAQARSPRVN